MNTAKQKSFPQRYVEGAANVGHEVTVNATGFFSSPFFCLPPSGVLMSEENIKKAGTINIRKNRTERNKTQSTNNLLWTPTNQSLKKRRVNL